MNSTKQKPDAATGDETKLATPYTNKRGFAERWSSSVRSVDNWLSAGLPHLAIGRRKIRICIAEGDAWMQEQFRTQRRATNGGGK